MIRYLSHVIMEVENIDTKEKLFQLSYWYTSDDTPHIAGARLQGYYKTHQDAEDAHNQLLVKEFIKNETT